MTIYTSEARDGGDGALIERDVVDTVAGTFTSFGPNGQQTSTRPLTADEVVLYAARDAAAVGSTNQTSLQAKAQAALTANQNDVTQDQTIITQAATVTSASLGTNAAVIAAVVKLAQAVSVLASNDVNTKKELQAILYLLLDEFTTTAGT